MALPPRKPKRSQKTGRALGSRGKLNPERLAIVADLLKRGTDSSTLQRQLATEWKVSVRTIRNYQYRVYAIWREHNELIDETLEAATIRQQLDDVYFQCYGQKDWRACIQLLRVRAATFLPQKHEHTGPKGAPIEVSQVSQVDLTKCSDEELEQLGRIYSKIPGLADRPGPAGGDEGGDPSGDGEKKRKP